jgi:hypothetical protein
MNSEEMNEKIAALDGLGGKNIPYLGWFWRTVDFDAQTCYLGVCENEDGEPYYIGFMQNNKWGYDEILCDEEAFTDLKQKITTALKTDNEEDFIIVQQTMQNMKEEKQ